ncbi:MAG: NUDIX domain-containing protein [Bacteroidales bacterium]|nr:NUDIX domain-containing protein [Bacteroidales bacterium]
MRTNLNPFISVDCVVFGYDDQELKVLLISRDKSDAKNELPGRYKLPGDMIIKGERLQASAQRVLLELTGLDDVFLKQFAVFDDPERLNTRDDLKWLQVSSGIDINRVVTIAYYALIKLEESKKTKLSVAYNACWFSINEIPEMIFDHNVILNQALSTMQKGLLTDPHCFELLPEKFTLNQLQKVYETILNVNLDNRNFRKKVQRLNYIIPLNETQKGVAHKPARFFIFKRDTFDEVMKDQTGMVI